MIMNSFRCGTFIWIVLLVCSLPLKSHAQIGGMGGGESSRIEGKTKFMPIPYVNYDRSMGFTLGAVPMLMFNPTAKDTLSPSSLIGGVGIYSTNKTWFMMGFGMFFLNEDRWRITTAGGLGVVNFQFFLDHPIWSGWIPYSTEADFFMFRLERKIYESLYAGISYTYADMVSSPQNLPLADSVTLHGLGLNFSYDRRNNPHYPRCGFFSSIKYNDMPRFLGNETSTRKIEADYNHYFSTRQNKDVVAARFYAGLGLGDVAFSQQFIVKGKDIRGYTQGAVRGNYLLAIQGEYRWNFASRWGAVAYGGVASVFKTINESDNGKLLPGAGTGIRFIVFPETHFSVGLDVAVGVEDWGIYFQIGEAF